MKLMLTVAILCNLVIAQGTSFVKQLELSTPTPKAFVLKNTSREICNDYDGCAFVEYDAEAKKNSIVRYRDCDCPEGNECMFERDTPDDCPRADNCLNNMDSLPKSNRNLNRYVCRKRLSVQNHSTSIQNGNNFMVQRLFFLAEMDHIISEIRFLSDEEDYITSIATKVLVGRDYNVPVDIIKKETDYLDNILACFDNDIDYLEKVADRIKNLKVPPEDAISYSKIDSLKRIIQYKVERTKDYIVGYNATIERKRE